MPSACSRAGTTSLVTIPDSFASDSVGDVTAIVTTVICAGSNVRTVGAGRSCGSADFAVWIRSCTSVRSVVWFESSVKVAEIEP